MNNPTVQFTASILVCGEHREAGSTLEVTPAMADELVGMGRAVIVSAAEAAAEASEPPTKKAKK